MRLSPAMGKGATAYGWRSQGLDVDTLDLSAFGVDKAKRLAAARGGIRGGSQFRRKALTC